MFKKVRLKRVFCFRRYSRAKYAVFRSLREFCIGHVASYIAEKQLLKSKMAQTVFCLVPMVLSPMALLAEDDPDAFATQQLDEVSVVALKNEVASEALHVVSTISAKQLQSLPSQSLNDMLDYLPGIDIRTRSGNGAQADISMRGGTFDQVLILLNGINITDAQTGHGNLDIPIDLNAVERIEILQGTSVCQFGLSAFSGAINIVTKSHDKNCVKAAINAGEYGYFAPSADVGLRRGKWRIDMAGNYNQSTGYTDNTDYKYGNLYANVQCDDSLTGKWTLQLGGQLKAFGANSFFSLAFPDQFEATRTLLGSLQWQRRFDHVHMEAALFHRTRYDRFELFREGVADFPDWYTSHNYHSTNISGANAKAAYLYHFGKSTIGVELRNENIKSNTLGNEMQQPVRVPFAHDTIFFVKTKNRLNINYFAEQTFYAGNFLASIGFSGNYNTMFQHNFAATANVGYKFAKQGSLFANVSRALRLPTFTDLYYHSATQLANPNLKPESSCTAELGLNWTDYGVRTNLNVYYRVGQNLIDWVKKPDEIQWQCVNYTRVDAWGGEVRIGYSYGYWLKNIEMGYAYCQLDKNSGEYLSKYALDYLKHKLTFNLAHGIYKGFGANWQFVFQQRNGSYTDRLGEVQTYAPVFLLDGRVFWQNEHIQVYAEATNLTGCHYYDYGGIEQPGRWIKAGITVNMDW